MPDLTILDLVQNGTMTADIAAVLWAAAEEQVSFLTVAIPRSAGKSTTSRAVLNLRQPGVPLHHVDGDAEDMARLKREKLGGYLVVDEFSRAPIPGYIWGAPVQRVFDTLEAGYSLQTSLHAPGVDAAIQEVTRGNRISDAQASAFKLVIYIEVSGATRNLTRRVADVFEVHAVENGLPIGHSLFRWHADGDRFEKLTNPHQWGRDHDLLNRRSEVIAELVAAGRTDTEALRDALTAFRSSHPISST